MQDIDQTVEKIAQYLIQTQQNLCVAESCTGGLISSLLTNRRGASDFFLGSVISYSNIVKISQLGVSSHLLEKKGAVNEEVALSMASGIKSLLKADWSLSITGMLEGDSIDSYGIKVGSIFVSVCGPTVQNTSQNIVSGLSRQEKKEQSASFSLDLLLSQLLQYQQEKVKI